jgi:hypothetical protein
MPHTLKDKAVHYVFPEARLSYVTLAKPKSVNPGQTPKYSLDILIPKSNATLVADIQAAVEAARQLGIKRFGWHPNADVRKPMLDGDGLLPNKKKPHADECHGHWVIRTSSERKPKVVERQPDRTLLQITDETQIYSGMWGAVSVDFFPYDGSTNCGISAGLLGVLKLRDDTPFGASFNPEDDFADIVGSAPAQSSVYSMFG